MKNRKTAVAVAAACIALFAACKAKENSVTPNPAETKNAVTQIHALSGKYLPEDEDCIYDYLDFKGSVVKTSTLGLGISVSVPYEVKDQQVIISDSSGTVVLDIEDENNLVGDSWPIEGIRFTKK